MDELSGRIAELAAQAQRLIDELHARAPEDETFSQLGILDGAQIIGDYLGYGELGCAVHHLLYVVHESNIPFPRSEVRDLHEIAGTIGEPNHYSEESLAAKPSGFRAKVYNRLR